METNKSQLEIEGETITIRPIQLSDMTMESEFVNRLSSESKHYRFLGGVGKLTPAMLKELCDVDHEHSMAFVATIDQEGKEVEIGVSRYAQDAKADTREIAITVADEWQHKGLGTLLAKQLIEYAKDHGVNNIYSMDFASNTHMRQLAQDLGMSEQRDPDDTHQVIYSMSL